MENKKAKICLIANIGAHYRLSIFQQIDRELDCDFYLGDCVSSPIKTFNYTQLSGYRKTLHNKYFHNFYWQPGSVRLVLKPYTHYILDGEPYCLSTWVILLLCRLLGKQTISWSHGWYGRESFLKRFIKKAFFSLFTRLMIYGEYAIGLMKHQGFNPNKMYCIANSLDSDQLQHIRQTLIHTDIYQGHFHNTNPTLIYCGRIQRVKKLELLVDALALLRKQGITANLVFVGKDVDQVGLDQYAEQKELAQQVWMYGPCYDQTVLGELFYNAAVCVSPGHVGLTAIHALSFGCPVVTHNNFAYQGPEFEAIQPGITGDFYHQGDLSDLVNCIKRWLTTDTARREEIHRAAFAEIDRKWNIHYQINVLKQVIYE